MQAAILTLGCRLNQADSALMTARLERMGISVEPYTPDTDAGLLILNSCAVTATAERKTRQTLRSLASRHPDARLILTGCAFNAFPDGLPGVTVLPNDRKRELEDAVRQCLSDTAPAFETVFQENILTAPTDHTRANLKIQEGCNHFCTYCIVPYKRGRERSRDLAETVRDFRHLVELGYQEIVLTGINTCTYDCRGAKLPDLLETLLETQGNYRIRIGSTEPGPVLTKIVDVMAKADGRLCEFLHPSLQSGSDSVLKRMNRHCLTAQYAEYVSYARERIPQIHIGTDLITGFPGETDSEFEETFAFAERMQFANLHVFPFSPRKGTAACTMKPVVPNSVSCERAARLSELGRQMAERFRNSLIGTIQSVLPEQDGHGWTGNYIQAKAAGHGLRKVRISGVSGTFLTTEE